MAFTKLDSNGDGFIDLEELISKLPLEAETDTATRNERLLEVRCIAYRFDCCQTSALRLSSLCCFS